MKDSNEFRFSGTVEQFHRIETRTGTPMISFTVMCWKERIRVTAFKDLAEQTLLERGDRIECRGHIQSTEWTDKEGAKRTGWQVIAHEITQPGTDQEQASAPERKTAPATSRDTGDNYAYQGGPF